MVTRFCHFAHRCNQISCATCCWRAARNTTIQIQNKSNGPLRTITLTISDPSPKGFRAWRVQIRNRIDHLRRNFPEWRKIGFHGWLQNDGSIRGIASLGRVSRGEVEKGLERWSAALGPEVGHKDLRAAICAVTKPSVIAPKAGTARYQGLNLNTWPCREPVMPHCSCSLSSIQPYQSDPMPIVF